MNRLGISPIHNGTVLSMVAFRLPKGTDTNTPNKFVRGLYGQDSKSWSGKYKFRRKGILEEVQFREFIRGVIIQDLEKIIPYLAKYGPNTMSELSPTHRKAMLTWEYLRIILSQSDVKVSDFIGVHPDKVEYHFIMG